MITNYSDVANKFGAGERKLQKYMTKNPYIMLKKKKKRFPITLFLLFLFHSSHSSLLPFQTHVTQALEEVAAAWVPVLVQQIGCVITGRPYCLLPLFTLPFIILSYLLSPALLLFSALLSSFSSFLPSLIGLFFMYFSFLLLFSRISFHYND